LNKLFADLKLSKNVISKNESGILNKVILFIIAFSFFALIISARAAVLQQTIVLKPGFNFISFTISVGFTPQKLLIDNPAIENIYLYSSASGSFLSAKEGTLNSLGLGKGYILKLKSGGGFTLTVSGSDYQPVGNVIIRSGYNLIGFSKIPSLMSFSQFMNNYGIIKGIYKWSPSSGSFINVVRNNDGTPVLLEGIDPQFKAGESYFIKTIADNTINYDSANIIIGDGTIIPAATQTEVPLSVLLDVPAADQIVGTGDITGQISAPIPSAAPGISRAITIKSLSNIKVWVKNHPEITVKTNDSGEFTLKNVPVAQKAAGHTLEYEKIEDQGKFNGIINSVPVLENKKIDLKKYIGPLVIKPSATIQGRVVLSDGLSPLGTDVYVAGISGMIAKADEDGSFSLLYIPEGTFSVIFQNPGYEIIKKEVGVLSGEIKQLDRVVIRKSIVASTVGSLDGFVIGDDNMPVAGTLVSLIAADATIDLGTNASATGHFQFDNVSPGKYKLICIKDGYKGSEQSFAVSAGEEKQVNQTLIKAQSAGTFGTLSGSVKDAKTQTPVRNTAISTLPPTEQLFTDNNGYFSAVVESGEYTLIFKKAGYKDNRLSIKVPQDRIVKVNAPLENAEQQPVNTIVLNSENLTIKQGQSFQFNATLKDSDGNTIFGKPITWSVSNDNVGSISSTGLFTPDSPGFCVLSAGVEDKTVRTDINVTAAENAVKSLKIIPSQVMMNINDIRTFTLIATYADGSVKIISPSQVSWAAGTQFSMIEKGAFIALSSGSGKVTANFGGILAESQIFVGTVVSDDLTAPQIMHSRPLIQAGKELVIIADATDNVSISKVWLDFKIFGEQNYQKVEMKKNSAGKYSYTITSNNVTDSGIQYYLTAEDTKTPVSNFSTFPASGSVYPLILKPLILTNIKLSRISDKVQPSSNYDLSAISSLALYSDSSSKIVSPSWEIISGGGSISGKIYASSASEGGAVLKAKYSESGKEVFVNFNLTIEKNPFAGDVPDGKGWSGKVYGFSYAIKGIPDFSIIGEPAVIINAPNLNITPRIFDIGFPGLGKDIVENFAIRFSTRLNISTTKDYSFKLTSDGGSKLYIDNRMVIDNSGFHAVVMKSGAVNLTAGEHVASVEYFHGPKGQIALQLLWNDKGSDAPVPVDNTILWNDSKTPSELVLLKTSDTVPVGQPYNLLSIPGMIRYLDNSTAPVLPRWLVGSGGGNIIGTNYIASITGSVILTASYTESGLIKTANMALNVIPVAAAPQFNPAPESYNGQGVSLTSSTAGALIKYTIDGTNPSVSNGALYSGPIVLSTVTTIKAIALKNGCFDSAVTTATYNYMPAVSIALSPATDTITINSSYDLSKLKIVGTFINNSTREVPVSWSVASGGGVVSGNSYIAPADAGTAILTAAYNYGGIIKTAVLGMNVTPSQYNFMKNIDTITGGKIALDSQKNVYVTNYWERSVSKYNANGALVKKWTSSTGSASTNIYGLAIDSSNNIYVSDQLGGSFIKKYDTNGNFISNFKNAQYGYIAIDRADNVYTLEPSRGQKFDKNGNYIMSWEIESDVYRAPKDIAVNSKGEVYVIFNGRSIVQKYNSNGMPALKWGSSGIENGQFDPAGIAIDSFDNVYVSDSNNSRVQKFDANGNFLTKFSISGSSEPRGFYSGSIALDASGNIYVLGNGIKVFAQALNVSVASLTLSPSQDSVEVQTSYNLLNVHARVNFTDGTSREVGVTWTADTGRIVADYMPMSPPAAYFPSTTADVAILTAAYTETGVRKEAVLRLNIKYTVPPAAPTYPTPDDKINTFGWYNNSFYTNISNYEYTSDNGASWISCTTNPITGITGNIASGNFKVRVKANIWGRGEPAGIALSSSSAFTSAPAAPVSPVVNDGADTFDWTNAPSFTSISDYEYTKNNGSTWTVCGSKPITTVYGIIQTGWVQVRVKANAAGSGEPAGTALASNASYTSPPAAPTVPVVSDRNNTFGWTNNPSYTDFTSYEYTKDNGVSWNTCTANPQTGILYDINTGEVQVRIRANTLGMGEPSSPALQSDSSYTYVPAAPPFGSENDAANTFSWTNNPLYTVAANYEYTNNNGGSWFTCSSNPVTGLSGIIPPGWVQIRVRNNAGGGGDTAGVTLASSVPFTDPPAAPVSPVENDLLNTFAWTNTPSYTSVSNYEYSTNGGAAWSLCTANPQPGISGDISSGWVKVRIRANVLGYGEPASAALSSLAAYTIVPPAPPAPTLPVVNDKLNSFDWTANILYPVVSMYEYSIDGGSSWTACTIKPQTGLNTNATIGAVRVRVMAEAAVTGEPAGDQLLSTEAFTNPPPAPAGAISVDGVTNTFDWTNVPSYTAVSDYEYTKDNGTSWTLCTIKPLQGFWGNITTGWVKVRVKLNAGGTGESSGGELSSTVGYTAP